MLQTDSKNQALHCCALSSLTVVLQNIINAFQSLAVKWKVYQAVHQLVLPVHIIDAVVAQTNAAPAFTLVLAVFV